MRFGPPVYVRRQIVHNAHVVRALERQGAVFVAEIDDIPGGARVVLAAHGVSPDVRRAAAARALAVIDATCPLVTKTHREVRRFAADGYSVILIGEPGHDEVVGTAGEAPDQVVVITDPSEVDHVTVPDETRVAWVSQTTLNRDHVVAVVERLRRRFPALVDPPSEDICYAVTNRQRAVREIAADSDLFIVVGDPNSHNSRSMLPVARSAGAKSAYMVDSADEMRPEWLVGVTTIGVSSGASVPDVLVQNVIGWLADHGYPEVTEVKSIVETMAFAKPRELTLLRQ